MFHTQNILWPRLLVPSRFIPRKIHTHNNYSYSNSSYSEQFISKTVYTHNKNNLYPVVHTRDASFLENSYLGPYPHVSYSAHFIPRNRIIPDQFIPRQFILATFYPRTIHTPNILYLLTIRTIHIQDASYPGHFLLGTVRNTQNNLYPYSLYPEHFISECFLLRSFIF